MGEGALDDIIGGYEVGEGNDRGDKLVEHLLQITTKETVHLDNTTTHRSVNCPEKD